MDMEHERMPHGSARCFINAGRLAGWAMASIRLTAQ